MSNEEIYISVDIETDGPIPGTYSMLSLGAVALKADKTVLGEFEINLETLPNAKQSESTMEWWSQPEQRDAWEYARKDPKDPKYAMEKFVEWVKSFEGKPVFVGWPVAFDFTFVYWYIINFLGDKTSPFGRMGFSAVDVGSFAMAELKMTREGVGKKTMPQEWFADKFPHTHKALDDAKEQGHVFCNMLAQNRGSPK